MDEQLRITDLIPRRLTTFVLLMMAGLVFVTGLEALYAWMPELAPLTHEDGRVAAFDLDGEGSLAVWFSSVTLLAAGMVSWVIYYVRRHRKDDYQGRYRIYLAAAVCWVVMSMDETASLHEGFKEMMTHITGTRLIGDGSLWWAIPYFFILGVVGSRLLVDMRECVLSSTALATTAVCYIVAIAAQLQWIMPEMGAKGVMLEEGAEMTGNLFLLLAMGLHARYVILDAEGLLPKKEEPEEEEEEEEEVYDEQPEEEYEEQETGDEWVKVDSPHKAPQTVLKRKEKKKAKRVKTSALRGGSKPKRMSAPEPDEPTASDFDFTTESEKPLSNREKKALRKRLIRQRMERERKQHKAWK